MDDLSGKINELLSDPESMEKIKNLASMFASSSGGGASSESEPSDGGGGGGKSGGGGDGGFPIDPAMLMKLKSAMDLMHKDDPRVDLLLALKPNLSGDRRKKIDEAIHILRLLSLMPMLREQGIFENIF
jgi:Predicted membrane protein